MKLGHCVYVYIGLISMWPHTSTPTIKVFVLWGHFYMGCLDAAAICVYISNLGVTNHGKWS